MSDTLTHPSYGKVVLNKVTAGGEGCRLFGSDIAHRDFVEVKVYRASLEQGMDDDFVNRTRSPLIKFRMTEAQWAHMLSSFSDGNGTAVTLAGTELEPRIEEPPIIPTVIDNQRTGIKQVTRELGAKARSLKSQLAALLAGTGTIKRTDIKQLAHDIDIFASHVESNIDWVEGVVIERMEKEVSKAAIEVEAMVQNAVNRLGWDAVAQAKQVQQANSAVVQGEIVGIGKSISIGILGQPEDRKGYGHAGDTSEPTVVD